MTRGPRPCTLQFIHYNGIIYITAALIWHHQSCIPCSNSLPFPPVLFIIFHCLLSWLVARGHTWRIGCSFFGRFFWRPRQNPLHTQMQFDCACLCCTVCFQMNSWENMVAFWPAYIPVSHPPLLLWLLYFPAGPSFPFCLSLSSSLCFSDWLFEPSMGPGGIVRHAFFLPKFCLCVLQSHWGLPSPFPVYSSFVASRKAFILHLFSSAPPLHCNHPSFSPLPPFWKRQEVNADVGPTWAHFSFSCSLCHDLFLARSFFFPADPHGWRSCYITRWTHWHTEPHSGGCPSQ